MGKLWGVRGLGTVFRTVHRHTSLQAPAPRTAQQQRADDQLACCSGARRQRHEMLVWSLSISQAAGVPRPLSEARAPAPAPRAASPRSAGAWRAQ